MNPNNKRQANRLQFAALLRWVIIVAFLGVAGLSYLYLKHQLYVLSNERKSMEQDLRDLIAQNNVLETRVVDLTSYTALRRRIDDGFLKLVPINDHTVVHVHNQDGSRLVAADNALGNQFQTVAHENSSRR